MSGTGSQYGRDDITKHRVSTMLGDVISEGDTAAEAMLAAAMVKHPGLTVQVPPGERAVDAAAYAREAIRGAFDVDADEGEDEGDG